MPHIDTERGNSIAQHTLVAVLLAPASQSNTLVVVLEPAYAGKPLRTSLWGLRISTLTDPCQRTLICYSREHLSMSDVLAQANMMAFRVAGERAATRWGVRLPTQRARGAEAPCWLDAPLVT
jgi:hypothetical protein